MNGTAKEILGKTSTVRSSPEVISGNDTGKRIGPYTTIEFVRVVDGRSVPADKWLMLPDGNYVNYIVAGRSYYQILTQPTPDPPPPPAGGETVIKLTYDTANALTGVNVDGVNWVKP